MNRRCPEGRRWRRFPSECSCGCRTTLSWGMEVLRKAAGPVHARPSCSGTGASGGTTLRQWPQTCGLPDDLPRLVFRWRNPSSITPPQNSWPVHPREWSAGPALIPNVKVPCRKWLFYEFLIRTSFGPTSGMGTSISSSGACLRFYDFHASFFSFPCGSKLRVSGALENGCRNGRRTLPRPSPPFRSGTKNRKVLGKAFLFNQQFKHTRILPFPILPNHDTGIQVHR